MPANSKIEQLCTAYNAYSDGFPVTEDEVARNHWASDVQGVTLSADIMWENESPIAGISATHDNTVNPGVLWCTNQRIVYVQFHNPRFLRMKVLGHLEYSYDSITRVEHQIPSFSFTGKHSIVLHIATASAKGYVTGNLFSVSSKKAAAFVQAIKDAQHNFVNKNRTPNRSDSSTSKELTVVTELERLAALYGAGMLSADEFLAAKKKMLGA